MSNFQTLVKLEERRAMMFWKILPSSTLKNKELE
jgi:hypothetical protein